MAQRYFVVYGEDSEDGSLLTFECDGLEELLLELAEVTRDLPGVDAVSEWLSSFYVFPDGTSVEKAAAECGHFIVEGKPGDLDPVFPEEDEELEE